MKKLCKIIIISLVVLLSIFVYGCSQDSVNGKIIADTNDDNGEIKVGAVIPLTGWGAYWGEPVLNGIEMAEREINMENDVKINIIVEDVQSNSKMAANAASKLINTDNVDVLYSEFSGFSSIVSPIANDNEIPLFYNSFNQKIVEQNELSFKMFISFENVCREFLDIAEIEGYKKLAFMVEAPDILPFCLDVLYEKFDQEDMLIYENIADKDFRSHLLKIKEFEADVIIMLTYEDTSLSLLKQKKDLGLDMPSFGYKQDGFTEKVINEVGIENLENTIFFEADVSDVFREKYFSNYQTDSVDDLQPAAFAYHAMNVIYELMKDCNKTQCLIDKSEGIDFNHGFNSVIRNREDIVDLKFTKIVDGKRVLI